MTDLFDLDAEQRVLGSCLLAGRLVAVALRQLTGQDFSNTSNRWLFDLFAELHRDGHAGGGFAEAVTNEVKNRSDSPVTPMDVITLQANAPGTNEEVFGYAIHQVLRYSVARRVASAAGEIRARALQGVDEPEDLVDYARLAVGSVEVPVCDVDQVPNLSTVDAFLDAATEKPTPWVIPGLLREGWRCMIVAAEGAGKSVATRQLAICAAQGVHPFRFSTMPPVRTLIVDLENPDDAIAQTCKPITARAKLAAQDYEPGRAWLWRQPGGVDLRTRVGRGRLEAVVAATQPDLVCLGPVYKAYRSSAKESDELAAGEVQGVLDDLRTRYRFAVVLEHHAPKAQGGYRDLLPYGSSLWLRWPELGVKFTQDQNDKRSVKVGRFRQDRVEASWPDRLDRGGLWPWTGFWHNAEEASA